MGSHPINLAARFILELAALAAMAIWGWRTGEGGLQFVLAFGVPIVAAGLWGTFAVLEDPSRSGKAPVPVPGLARLLLEMVFFVFAVWALNMAGFATVSWIMAGVLVLHYIASYDRVWWLLRH